MARALDGPAEGLGPNNRPSESANMGAIKEAFRAFSEDGVTAGVDVAPESRARGL